MARCGTMNIHMELVKKYGTDSLVGRAYAFAATAHKDEKRASGDPYFTHCKAVAGTVSEWGLDEASIAAALLHDVAEDTSFTLDDIGREFGPEVRFLVEGVTKLKNLPHASAEPVKESGDEAENLRKFIISFAEDIRVLLVKLADRLHNMRTLGSLPPERRHTFAWETLELYGPLAYRLGMQKLSGELEDLAFPFVLPKEYEELERTVKEPYEERLAYARSLAPKVETLLASHGVPVTAIDARAKRHYSLYKKLLRHDRDLGKIYDLVAVRIIVPTVEDCYAAVGVIHGEWPPFPGRFKDYVARPKSNGYRSLHTTVFCVDRKVTEFQIRTPEMHAEAELGIAAHWAYQQARNTKKANVWSGIRDKKELRWVEQLRNWQRESASGTQEFQEALKTDFFRDRLYALTPENDIIDLPAEATPVDFAYHIHSDIGDQCIGARVNGKMVPLDTPLRSGDMVEIITQKGKKPSKDWLRFVKTALAKKQIRSVVNAPKNAAIRRLSNPPPEDASEHRGTRRRNKK